MAALINSFAAVKLSNTQFKSRPFFPSQSVSLTRRRLTIRAADIDTNEGITASNIWKIRLQLTKPVTWPPLIWGVVCGAAASGNFHWTPEDVAKSILCMLMSGPCLTGYTQTLNDWYDRDIDAINEPYRPIPSGAIGENEVITQIWVLFLAGLVLAGGLDVWAGHKTPILFYLALGGSFISYIYSAPPLKLGIAIVNDFKSVEGDRAMGLQSIPVAFGTEAAKWICVGAIDITQLSVAVPISPKRPCEIRRQISGKRAAIPDSWSSGDCLGNQPLVTARHLLLVTLSQYVVN
ncbi:hypothetical protein KSS87_001004 [Heliosperma pusillum]|nr:hypothetical protein KSS87_001004 [Heliosperma pusillum]